MDQWKTKRKFKLLYKEEIEQVILQLKVNLTQDYIRKISMIEIEEGFCFKVTLWCVEIDWFIAHLWAREFCLGVLKQFLCDPI